MLTQLEFWIFSKFRPNIWGKDLVDREELLERHDGLREGDLVVLNGTADVTNSLSDPRYNDTLNLLKQ